ncbi:MAG: hypothetical protein E3J56_00980 [Candidatus Aminicenantes bacterium]|nr:MAG: hypothetical protein E3J56_00980 [Candidatus Aminicenantes bacterium]
MKKLIFILLCILAMLGALCIHFAASYSTYGAPSEFGNLTNTTAWLGGDYGELNITGSAKIDGNLTSSWLKGILTWSYLIGYPSTCTSGQYISALGDTLSCAAIAITESQISDLKDYVEDAGDTMTGSLTLDDGVGESPRIYFINQLDNSSAIYEQTDGDLYISAAGGFELAGTFFRMTTLTSCEFIKTGATGILSCTIESDPLWTANQSSYYLKSNPFTFWNSTFATFNKTYADTLYSTIAEPLWSANFSAYNSSWTSTDAEILAVSWANVTAGEWIIPEYILDVDDADIETDLNTYWDIAGDSDSGSYVFNFTNSNLTIDYFFGDGSQLTGITITETDPYWTGNQSSYWNTGTDLDTVISTDEITELKIDFNTVCGAGNHLYVSGNNLACEADDDTTYLGGNAITLVSTTFNFDGGASPAGDLGGTWASPSVDDDSHNHIYSNIDATTSANWASRVSDETGTGKWVFATNPTFLTGITVPANSISDDELNEGLTFEWTGTHTFAASGTFNDDLIFADEIKPDNVLCSNNDLLFKTGADNWDCKSCAEITGSVDLCDGGDAINDAIASIANWQSLCTSCVTSGDLDTDYISEEELNTLTELDTQIGITGTPSSSTYLRGDNSWASVTATGDLRNSTYCSATSCTISGIEVGDDLFIWGKGATTQVFACTISLIDEWGTVLDSTYTRTESVADARNAWAVMSIYTANQTSHTFNITSNRGQTGIKIMIQAFA